MGDSPGIMGFAARTPKKGEFGACGCGRIPRTTAGGVLQVAIYRCMKLTSLGSNVEKALWFRRHLHVEHYQCATVSVLAATWLPSGLSLSMRRARNDTNLAIP